MYCTKCGKHIPDDSRTCPECGCDLSYESNILRNELSPRKEQKKTSSSHLGGILTACAAALVAAECVYLLGFAPVRIAPSTSFVSAGTETSQGVIELIPTVDTSAPAASASSEAVFTEPTPTPTVTPIASGQTETSPAVSPEEASSLPAAEADDQRETVPAEEPVPEPTEEPVPEPTEEPAPEPTQTSPVTSSSQLIPSSSSEPISTSDLEGMSAAEIRIARNEIYARHGLIFQSEDLQEYFNAQDWYEGTVSDADSISLSELEVDNIEKIVNYEEEMDLSEN